MVVETRHIRHRGSLDMIHVCRAFFSGINRSVMEKLHTLSYFLALTLHYRLPEDFCK